MPVIINKHLVITSREQEAIVNALDFYHRFHADAENIDLKHWQRVFREDGANFVYNLATKVATIQ